MALISDVVSYIMTGVSGGTINTLLTALVQSVTTLPCHIINVIVTLIFGLFEGIINAVLSFAGVPTITLPTPPSCV